MWVERCVYFCVHVTVHVVLYAVPRLVTKFCVYWRMGVLRLLGGSKVAAESYEPRRERYIKVITHPTRRDGMRLFGLDETWVGNRTKRAQVRQHYQPHYDGPLYNGHIHTILGAFRAFPDIAYQREVVKSYDGNRLCIDFAYPNTFSSTSDAATASSSSSASTTTCERPRAMVMILPGLTGSSTQVYLRRLAYVLLQHNMAIAVLNARGVADTPLDVPQMFSGYFTADVRHVLQHTLSRDAVQTRLRSPHPVPVLGVAFSLGGIILTNYIGEQGQRGEPSGLDAVVTITSPHRLHDGDVAMRQPFTQFIYGWSFYGGLYDYYSKHADMIQQLPGINRELLFSGPDPLVEKLRTVREFDEYITAPSFGFPNADAYYTEADNFRRMGDSTTPQMSVIAKDDPICGPPQTDALWESVAEQQRAGLVYVEMPVGGHLGFVGGPLDELLGRPSPMERFVTKSLVHVVDTWYTGEPKEKTA